jgi:uncharacterized membrane protein
MWILYAFSSALFAYIFLKEKLSKKEFVGLIPVVLGTLALIMK